MYFKPSAHRQFTWGEVDVESDCDYTLEEEEEEWQCGSVPEVLQVATPRKHLAKRARRKGEAETLGHGWPERAGTRCSRS